ncbi:MAG: SUMF1/EgtB/PvdO family nonheme iron enzyme [Polyangiaceae bacterium]
MASGSSASSASASGSASPAPSASKPDPLAGMVRIPQTTFFMGRDGDRETEGPRHSVSVGAFYIDKLETTVAAYEECVNAGACKLVPPAPEDAAFCNYGKADRRDHPMNCVGWDEAKLYCEYRGKRLPHESEWELAARGTDERAYPWGNEPIDDTRACWNRLDKKLGTCAVGSFPKGASPYGVLDMSGNVSEWTSDMFCRYDDVPCRALERAGRGGSWDYANPANLTTTFRAPARRDHRKDLVGVRCARDE